jgi:hypothetical protein
VADPDSPPTAAQIRDVARAIGDGDVHIIVNGDRTNLAITTFGWDGHSVRRFVGATGGVVADYAEPFQENEARRRALEEQVTALEAQIASMQGSDRPRRPRPPLN